MPVGQSGQLEELPVKLLISVVILVVALGIFTRTTNFLSDWFEETTAKHEIERIALAAEEVSAGYVGTAKTLTVDLPSSVEVVRFRGNIIEYRSRNVRPRFIQVGTELVGSNLSAGKHNLMVAYQEGDGLFFVNISVVT